jgi:hypothetical protein
MSHGIELKAGGDLIVGDVLADGTDVISDGQGGLFVQQEVVTSITADPSGAVLVQTNILWGETVVNTVTTSVRRIQGVWVAVGDLNEFLPS